MSVERKELEWGETPWDDMSREELLSQVQMMYSALSSCRSRLATHKALDTQINPASPYWDATIGMGGKALAKADAVIEPIHKKYSDESMQRCFFRYADDLFFGPPVTRSQWLVCPECGKMIAVFLGSTQEGTKCNVAQPRAESSPTRCSGVLRYITWDDLKPKEKVS